MADDVREWDLDDVAGGGPGGSQHHADLANGGTGGGWGSAVVSVRALVVSVSFAIVLASGLTHAWDGSRAQRARLAAATVALQVSVPTGVAGDQLAGSNIGHRWDYSTSVHVSNIGPRPIEVGSFAAAAAGFILGRNDLTQFVAVPVGGAVDVPIHLAVDCRDWVGGTSLALHVGVRTADHVQRSTVQQVPTHLTDWDAICSPL